MEPLGYKNEGHVDPTSRRSHPVSRDGLQDGGSQSLHVLYTDGESPDTDVGMGVTSYGHSLTHGGEPVGKRVISQASEKMCGRESSLLVNLFYDHPQLEAREE